VQGQVAVQKTFETGGIARYSWAVTALTSSVAEESALTSTSANVTALACLLSSRLNLVAAFVIVVGDGVQFDGACERLLTDELADISNRSRRRRSGRSSRSSGQRRCSCMRRWSYETPTNNNGAQMSAARNTRLIGLARYARLRMD
jgi:hypothetical protein